MSLMGYISIRLSKPENQARDIVAVQTLAAEWEL